MKDRHLVLLGGAGGIGRAVVARALAEGWQVTVADLPASLERHPVPSGVAAVPLDLSETEAAEAALKRLGPMNGFVNLAGFMTDIRPLSETDLDGFDEVMAGNYRGALVAARAVLPGLRARGGAMVQVVSGLAANVRPGYGLYGANKAAMVHMTKTLALECAPDIRVNAVAPAAVDTAFLRGGTGRSEEDGPEALNRDAYVAATPLARLALPDDIVGPILFLLGPDASFMTGQVLWVNGGGYMP